MGQWVLHEPCQGQDSLGAPSAQIKRGISPRRSPPETIQTQGLRVGDCAPLGDNSIRPVSAAGRQWC